MTYTRKKPQAAHAPALTYEQVEKSFVDDAKEVEKFYEEIDQHGDTVTVQEMVAGVHMVGTILHEKLMDLSTDPRDQQVLVDGVIKIFKDVADQSMVFKPDTNDPHVVYRPNPILNPDHQIEITGQEANQIIRRTALCYGLVSGMGRAAAEAMREDNGK